MKTAATLSLVLAFLLSGNLAAQDKPDDAASIAPFVNNFTLGVIRVEPAGIDFDALQRWGEDVVKQSRMEPDDLKMTLEGVRQTTQAARNWTEQFTKAGGKALWVVATVENFPDDPVFVVVPLAKGADGPALQHLLAGKDAPPNNHVAQSRGALIFAENSKALDRVRSIMPQPRPELARALAEAGDAKIRVALIPSDDSRRVIESMVPKLPNGAASESLNKGMLWAAVTITPPANVTVHGVVQSQNNQAAEEFKQLLGEVASTAQKESAPDSGRSILRVLGNIVSHSQVKDDRVVVDLDEKQATSAATTLSFAVRRARIQSNRVRSASNQRQIMMGMFMYANEHKGQFPETLEQAARQAELPPQILINPNRPGENPGYVYIKPPDGVKAGSNRVVLYEKFRNSDVGINLGFADGHVEFWQLKPAQEEIRKAQEAKPNP